MSAELVVKHPENCTSAELEAFTAFAATGEEVDRADIERGSKRAFALLWIEKNGSLCSVAALKRPNRAYRTGIFEKANATVEPDDFQAEIGYVFTSVEHRGHRYARRLVETACEMLNGRRVYATVRAANTRMQRILRENGFVLEGDEYPSARSDVKLLLFVRSET